MNKYYEQMFVKLPRIINIRSIIEFIFYFLFVFNNKLMRHDLLSVFDLESSDSRVNLAQELLC